eukprot:gb/GECG01012825.1/.p1 GENE.gb/GECG01012825.1/~~gb/GECG01012825.1/.p1  ORF type:complete len:300 (+),score=25.73 gb/GECG01012825.1/:1-900(+)
MVRITHKQQQGSSPQVHPLSTNANAPVARKTRTQRASTRRIKSNPMLMFCWLVSSVLPALLGALVMMSVYFSDASHNIKLQAFRISGVDGVSSIPWSLEEKFHRNEQYSGSVLVIQWYTALRACSIVSVAGASVIVVASIFKLVSDRGRSPSQQIRWSTLGYILNGTAGVSAFFSFLQLCFWYSIPLETLPEFIHTLQMQTKDSATGTQYNFSRDKHTLGFLITLIGGAFIYGLFVVRWWAVDYRGKLKEVYDKHAAIRQELNALLKEKNARRFQEGRAIGTEEEASEYGSLQEPLISK